MKIIDAHAHVWDVENLSYPWIESGSEFDRVFSFDDYRAATKAAPIEKMVLVECDADPSMSMREVQWFEELSTIDSRVQGIVGHLHLTDNPSFDADLDLMASRPLVRGVRHNIQGNESNFALQQPFVNGVKEVGRRGLHFELCLTHDQLAETIDLVKLCPDTSFVLDHCAKPGIRDGGKEPWLTDMKNLSALPNVVCKISGLLTEADWEHWTQEEVLWYAENAAEVFGGSRIMFGSDWPVNEVAGGFSKWYELTRSLTSSWSPADRDSFYFNNAEGVYRL